MVEEIKERREAKPDDIQHGLTSFYVLSVSHMLILNSTIIRTMR